VKEGKKHLEETASRPNTVAVLLPAQPN
jgi:hypothetical protein